MDMIHGRMTMLKMAHFENILAAQVVMGILFSTILDGGTILSVFFISIVAYWIAVLVYLTRQRSFPMNRLSLVRYIWVAIFGLTTTVVAWLGYLR